MPLNIQQEQMINSKVKALLDSLGTQSPAVVYSAIRLMLKTGDSQLDEIDMLPFTQRPLAFHLHAVLQMFGFSEEFKGELAKLSKDVLSVTEGEVASYIGDRIVLEITSIPEPIPNNTRDDANSEQKELKESELPSSCVEPAEWNRLLLQGGFAG